jgi:hypothetical protein
MEYQLSLQSAKETFNRGIIPAVAFPAHATSHAVLCQQWLKVFTGILWASVAAFRTVHNSGGRPTSFSYRHARFQSLITKDINIHKSAIREALIFIFEMPAVYSCKLIPLDMAIFFGISNKYENRFLRLAVCRWAKPISNYVRRMRRYTSIGVIWLWIEAESPMN